MDANPKDEKSAVKEDVVIEINSSSNNTPDTTSLENTNTIPNNTACTTATALGDTDRNKAEDAKLVCSGEIIVKIEESPENLKSDICDKDHKVYGYHRKNRPHPTIWVYFQLAGMELPEDSEPLDYDPDRNSFIKLVFLIVFIMLASTAGLNSIVLFTDVLSDFFTLYGIVLVAPATSVSLMLNYIMTCAPCARRIPCNIVCLVISVLSMTTICCFVTVRLNTWNIILALAATCGVVLVCLFLACSSFDFTKWTLYVIVISTAFGIVSFIMSVYWYFNRMSTIRMFIEQLLTLGLGTTLSGVVLIIELQMVLGGNAVELAEDDYALGAYLLYNAIITMFLKILQIMGLIEKMQ